MNERIPIADLAEKLQVDPEARLSLFREQFFDALEHRLLPQCEALLNQLAVADLPGWQTEYRYYQAILFFEQRQFDRSELLLRELLAEELEPVQRAKVLLEMGNVLNEQGQWKEGERYFGLAQTAYAAIDDRLGQAKAYNNLGIAIRFQVEQNASPPERLDEAADFHQAALDLLERIADHGEEIQWEAERNWHGLGMVYGQLKQAEQALAAFQKDIALCEALDDPADLGISLSDTAAYAYQPLNQWQEATSALEWAISLLQEYADPLHLAEALTRRGNLLVAQGQLDAALLDYHAALEKVESIRARLTAPSVRTNYPTCRRRLLWRCSEW